MVRKYRLSQILKAMREDRLSQILKAMREDRLSQILKAMREVRGDWWRAPMRHGVDSMLEYLDAFPESTIAGVASTFDVTLPKVLRQEERGEHEPLAEFVERLSVAAVRDARLLKLEPDGPETEVPMGDGIKAMYGEIEHAASFQVGTRVVLRHNARTRGVVKGFERSFLGVRVLWDDGVEQDVSPSSIERTVLPPTPMALAHKAWREQGEPTAAAVMVVHQGEVLVERGDDGRPMGLPGGKRELGESLLACATRELLEETGVRLKRASPLCLLQAGQHLTAIFVALPTKRPGPLTAGCSWELPESLLANSRYPQTYALCYARLVHELTGRSSSTVHRPRSSRA